MVGDDSLYISMGWNLVHERGRRQELYSPEEGADERLQETLTTPIIVHAPGPEGNDPHCIGIYDILVSDDEDGVPVAGKPELEPDEAIQSQQHYTARDHHIPECYGPLEECSVTIA